MHDKRLNEKLTSYFLTYDAIDLISKFSALNLEFENQNKNLLTTYFEIFGLFNLNEDKPKASNKTIKEIIEILNNSSVMPPIQDPSESPFVEAAFFDHEYKVFNGINTSSVFYVNSIIELLLYRKTSLTEELKTTLLKYIKFLLNVSNTIYLKSGVKCDYDDHGYFEDLLFANDLDKKQKSLFFNLDFYKDSITEEEFNKYFLFCKPKNSLQKSLDEEFPFYYSRPFYKTKDSYFVLDPTCLGYFIKKLCLEIASEMNELDLFIKEFNNSVFSLSLEKAKILSGINPHNEKKIYSLDDSDLKAESYKIGNSKAVAIIYYGQTNIMNHIGLNLDADISKIIKNIQKAGIEADNIFTIILINSIYGTCNFSSGYRFKNQPLIISCTELSYILNNEKKNPCFLEAYSKFLNFYFPEDSMSMIFSQSNLISILNSKDYDFYLADDFKVRGNFLNLGFDCIYPYAIKYLKDKTESCAVFEGVNVPLKLVKYEDNIYFPNPILCPICNVKPLIVKIADFGFWVYSKNDDENGLLIARVIAYWMNQIGDALISNLNQFYYVQISKQSSGPEIIKFNENHCELRYTDEYIQSFNNEDNTNEIVIVLNILKKFELFTNNVASALYKVSSEKYKKIIYIIDPNKNLYLTPISEFLLPMRVCKIYESIFDDLSGEFIEKSGIKKGNLSNPSQTLHNVVTYLFGEFEQFLSQFNWLDSIKLCYLHCESILEELMLFQDNMKHQLALYPEHNKDIENNFNDLNTTSVCLRFVIEYLSSVRPSGKKIMDDADVQFAISLASAIIKWARLDDSLKCGLIDEINFLDSCRIGYDHSKVNLFNQIVSETASYDTSHNIGSIEFDNEFPFKDEVDKSYIFEHGFSTKDLMVTMTIFAALGSEKKDEIKVASIEELLSVLHRDSIYMISDETFFKVLDYIALDFRGKYYDGIIPNRELHPWKYNREYSLMRKPIIRLSKDKFLWGNRNTSNSYMFVIQTIQNGKEPSHKKGKDSIQVLNGKILEFNGNNFNNYCFEYLKQNMPEILFDKCIKSINNVGIKNESNETLGDVDILGIDKARHRIYLIETKDFFYSRNPSELEIEIKEMFVGDGKRKSFLRKELNRKEWFDKHIGDVVKHYSLDERNWKVFYTFLSNKPLISPNFVSDKINHTCLKKVTLQYLRSLK